MIYRTLPVHFVHDAVKAFNASADSEDYGLLSDSGDNGKMNRLHYPFWDN